MRYLDEDELKRLDGWVYKLKGVTVLDSAMRKWWNVAFRFVPLRTSPDTLTVLGFLAGVFCAALVLFYSPGLKNEVPAWVMVACAVGLFFYQTMDALDGKQCRRSGRSSGVEELFDHGCDSVNSILQYVVTSSCFVLGRWPMMWFWFLCVGNATFFSVHWRTYATGVVHVGKIDHTETQIMGMLAMLVTSAFGAQIWQTKVFDLPWTLMEIAIIATVVMGLLKVYENVKGGLQQQSSLVPASTFLIGHVMFAYAFYLTQAWIDGNDLLAVFGFFFGFFVSKQDQRIVVAHLVESKMRFFDASLIPVVAYTLFAMFGNMQSNAGYWMLWACCVFSFLDLAAFFVCVTNEFAEHYGFEIFTVRKGERTFWDAIEEDAPDPNNKPVEANGFAHYD